VRSGFEEYFKLTTPINLNNMHLFDPRGKIKRYESPLEVISEFYPVREEFYAKRKQRQLEVLEKEAKILTNQSRFFELVRSGELAVINQTKPALLQKLGALSFDRIPLHSHRTQHQHQQQGSSANNNNQSEGEGEDEGGEAATSDADYDYLLRGSLWNLTSERMQLLNEKAEKKKGEYSQLQARHPIDMWKEELEALRKAILHKDGAKVHKQHRDQQDSDAVFEEGKRSKVSSTKKKKKKKVVKKQEGKAAA